jgi:hypothetical protein
VEKKWSGAAAPLTQDVLYGFGCRGAGLTNPPEVGICRAWAVGGGGGLEAGAFARLLPHIAAYAAGHRHGGVVDRLGPMGRCRAIGRRRWPTHQSRSPSASGPRWSAVVSGRMRHPKNSGEEPNLLSAFRPRCGRRQVTAQTSRWYAFDVMSQRPSTLW